MEWDLKLSPWDLAQLGHELSIDQSSNLELDFHLRGHDCSLKLGGLGEFVPSETMVPSSSSTTKRARAPSNGGIAVACLVDGCVSDLSKCREYHRRHKVCEVHSKTPVVMVGGTEQRFCQQCSRFHFLAEFDEVKRSCRKRLDGHNRRRRKPRHDIINTRNLFTNQPGTGFSVYPEIFPPAASVHNWTRMIKSEEDVLYTNSLQLHLIDRQPKFTISPCSYAERKRFPFLQDGDAAVSSRPMVGSHAFQPDPKAISSTESSNYKVFPNEINGVLSSDCALSLLSSTSQTSGGNPCQVVQGDRMPMDQHLVSGLQFNGLGLYSSTQGSQTVSQLSPTVFSCPGMKNEQMLNAFAPEATEADLHCGCIYQFGGEGSSDATSQGFPFPWQH